MDKGFFGPLKSAFAVEVEKWLVQNSGEVVKLTDVAAIFKRAYSATAKINLAENAFKVTRIEPFDPDVIPKELYASSLVTERLPTEDQVPSADLQNNAPAEPVTADPLPEPLEENQTAISTGSNKSSIESKQIVNIHSILPLPKAVKREHQKGKRPSQKSEIVTSSPFKNMLKEKE